MAYPESLELVRTFRMSLAGVTKRAADKRQETGECRTKPLPYNALGSRQQEYLNKPNGCVDCNDLSLQVRRRNTAASRREEIPQALYTHNASLACRSVFGLQGLSDCTQSVQSGRLPHTRCPCEAPGIGIQHGRAADISRSFPSVKKLFSSVSSLQFGGAPARRARAQRQKKKEVITGVRQINWYGLRSRSEPAPARNHPDQ